MNDPKRLFLGCTVVGWVLIIMGLFVTRGKFFHWFFYADAYDSMMDFFNSMAETVGGDPYGRYHTLYTPLCNLFFYTLQIMVPLSVKGEWPGNHRGVTDLRFAGVDEESPPLDIREQQSCDMIYILYLMTLIAAVVISIAYKMRAGIIGVLIGFAVLPSYGSIYAIERGNVVNMTALFLMLFLFGFRSEKRWIRELSYLALAVSTGFRLYPFIFCILLIADRDFVGVVKTTLYSVILTILPVFALGGPGRLNIFWGQLINFNTNEQLYMYDYGMIDIVYHLFRPTIDGIITRYSGIDEAACVILGIASVIFIAGAFVHQKLWMRAFDLTILMILWQSRAVDYTLVFFVPAAVLMLMEEESVTKQNVLPIALLMLLVVAYPTTYIHGSRYLTLSHSDIVQMVCVIMLVYEGVRDLLLCFRHMGGRPSVTV